eukprot:13623356-Alexandrium_andersonii.AAC.1
MDEAGSGTDHPNMLLVKALRQHIWTQTESAVMDDVERDQPALVGPAPRSYRVVHEPPLRRAP